MLVDAMCPTVAEVQFGELAILVLEAADAAVNVTLTLNQRQQATKGALTFHLLRKMEVMAGTISRTAKVSLLLYFENHVCVCCVV